jgi:hypothetical protein
VRLTKRFDANASDLTPSEAQRDCAEVPQAVRVTKVHDMMRSSGYKEVYIITIRDENSCFVISAYGVRDIVLIPSAGKSYPRRAAPRF